MDTTRILDVAFASAGLAAGAPLMAGLMVAGKLDTGSPLFQQERVGRGQKPFTLVKFRTMRMGTKSVATHLASQSAVTPLGAWLRRTKLDELPQLVNVLKGEMSLVGPRPHAVDHNEHYRQHVPGYMQRHAFKPGITGLAQVEGWRGETAQIDAMERRVDADLRYQRDWSLMLDIKILIKTLLHLRSPNAY